MDRGVLLDVVVDGLQLQAFPGDTLASALLASGVRTVGRSVRRGRPRGIMTAGPEEPAALLSIAGPLPDPVVTATTVEALDGMTGRSLQGQGLLTAAPDGAARTQYDAVHHHCEVAVVGAGPAGLAAALEAARSGVRVVLLDERPRAGGALLGGAELAWAEQVSDALDALPTVLHLQRTAATGLYDDNYLVAVQRMPAHHDPARAGRRPADGVRERVWHIRAAEVVLATGSYERPVVFAGNDLPGVMLAESVRAHLHRHGVLAGEQVVLFTAHDDAYRVAGDLLATGASVVIVDPRTPSRQPVDVPDGPVPTGTVLAGAVVTRAHADDSGELSAVTVRLADGRSRRLPADLLAVSGGWNPNLALWSHAGGRPVWDAAAGTFRPGAALPRVAVAGSAAGLRTTGEIVDDGERAGLAAAEAAGTAAGLAAAQRHQDVRAGIPDLAPPADGLAEYPEPAAQLHLVTDGDQDPAALDEHFVDVQRDVTVADLARATGAGLRSVEHVKRYTTAGTAHDQGRTSAALTTALVSGLTGIVAEELGTTTSRPPAVPVAFAALAGREHGDLYDPVRTTGAHGWHVAHGAVFENVGQWKRPWYYPRPLAGGGVETMPEAVARECLAARTGVAFMDASTLGKIDVQGPDAGTFLDRIYTTMLSTLKVGAARYAVLCGVDGMVVDDGTALRLAPDRFVVTTTTGNAAKILDWMEEWLQTEWPDLRVRCTSVTEQWATLALIGPRSRGLLQRLAPEMDCSAATFRFMTAQDGTVADLPARVARISFSGELAYEISVSWSDAAALWDAVWAAGEPDGLTPYGTETMHVLRAEKGYPIVGQDTDGTQTPFDLGLGWAVSAKKADYLGKRSHARPDTRRADRKELVGLLPVDTGLLLPEGAQLVDEVPLPPPPVPMLGHVTSSYRSAALGRTFALALLSGGRARIGGTVHVVVDDVPRPAAVVSSVFVDPDGARRDGDPDDAGPGSAGPVGSGGAAGAAGPAVAATLPVSPLARFAVPFAELSGPDGGVRVVEEPLRTMIDVRVPAGSEAARAVSEALGCALPLRTGGVDEAPGVTALALGPDEYLVVRSPGLAATTEDAVRRAVAELGDAVPVVAVTDVSAARTAVRISGPRTRAVLAHGCAVDLARLGPGTCVQTVLAQCAVVLQVLGEPGSDTDAVRVLVRSSFAEHLARWLLVTAPEYV
ncbi:hypothetical protein GCM10011594_06100 [Nakamurella endophytica]|uniref:FAD-dependent oxidoreductase n=1 Tax=Nakamurella endophytica TaxID=1748367 RepID=A0A917SP30_9ACTN|nr:hypothetical protein GCM10011594_06100 [Nakamurella endophytica]